MIKVLINGINGKMGQIILKQIEKDNDLKMVVGVDIKEVNDNQYPIYQNIKEVIDEVDIIIDFSIPYATFKALEYAKEKNLPIIIATTGFTKEEEELIKEYSKFIPVFKESNMAYTIHLIADIISKLAVILDNSDIEIIETHHNKKIDAPSGTALALADSINKVFKDKLNYEYNRHDKHIKRENGEIGIHSIRGKNEIGSHSIIFFRDNETIEITHKALNRIIYADGVIKIAKELVKKDKGYYIMKDIINDE